MRKSIQVLLVIGCICICGCMVNRSQDSADDCAKNIRKKVDIAALQTWATNLLAEHQIGRTNYFGPFEAPQYLSNVCQHRKPSVYIQGGYYGEESFVRFFWGGATLGHWGLDIGSPTFKPRNAGEKSTQWEPGVYFFKDYH